MGALAGPLEHKTMNAWVDIWLFKYYVSTASVIWRYSLGLCVSGCRLEREENCLAIFMRIRNFGFRTDFCLLRCELT